MKDLLSVREVADRLSITRGDVYRLVDEGKLPAVQHEGHVLVRVIDVDAHRRSDRPDS